ncbi:MAG: YgiQ family radical SAM protein [Planctomycetes bacterium]|nr:YgiQ family radical SAM protein [Planctomycetota bacterium]
MWPVTSSARTAARVPPWPSGRAGLPFLPMTRAEVDGLGWEVPDVVFVTGDAYVDHPAFAMAVLGRGLEAAGFRVAILAQPDWRDAGPFRALGRPRLFFAVSAGNMDSMLNHYTANRRPRSDDAYSPGGRAGLRPDRATNVYCQRCREAYPGVPVIAGGVEASLRRLAHYDYWSDTVRPSILVSSKADLVGFGMGESTILEVARRLAAGEPLAGLRDLRGVAYLLGEREALPPFPASMRSTGTPGDDTVEIPSCEQVRSDPRAFAVATRHHALESSPFNARRLVQPHGRRRVVQNPPDLPLTRDEMDAVYDRPYARRPHPAYGEPIPAMSMMATSLTLMRGCFGGCTFCSITHHQGRTVQSRSQASVLREVQAIAGTPGFKGVVSDLGGPTANMYEMRCTRPEVEAVCRRPSCVHPRICKLLGTDHGPLRRLMKAVREHPRVRRAHVASGVRMDLASRDPLYVEDLARHHVGGHLKVAPEHASDSTLRVMKKPGVEDFRAFDREFRAASRRAGKPQYLVPYFIASHPGAGLEEAIELALFLKRNGYRPRQVQDFIPAPMDVAACMYHTGLDPMTLRPVKVVRALRDRQAQRALMQFFLPENYLVVRRALLEAGRGDLIGEGCEALIPARPPREAVDSRRGRAAADFGRMVHEVARVGQGGATAARRDASVGPAPPRIPPGRTVGYRPGRRGARAQGGQGRSLRS